MPVGRGRSRFLNYIDMDVKDPGFEGSSAV